MTQPDQYVLGYRQEEQARLQQQAQELAHESDWLFDQIPLTRGARVVEIGCGPHGCLALLSERVGPTGASWASSAAPRLSPSPARSFHNAICGTSTCSRAMPDPLGCPRHPSTS